MPAVVSASSQPLVSILIPVFNRENLVEECVRSALRQTYRNIEIIVSDNQSTDGTWGVLQRLAAEDPRVRIFRNETNLGPVRNWQCCVQEAKGEFSKILFSDDLIREDCIALMVAAFTNHPEAGFVVAPAIVGTEAWKGETHFLLAATDRIFSQEEYLWKKVFPYRSPVSPGAALLRTQDIAEALALQTPSLMFSDHAQHGAGTDLHIFLHALEKHRKAAFVREPLSFFRMHPSSITMSNRGMVLLRYDDFLLSLCQRRYQGWLRAASMGFLAAKHAPFPGREALPRRLLALGAPPERIRFLLLYALFFPALWGLMTLRRMLKG